MQRSTDVKQPEVTLFVKGTCLTPITAMHIVTGHCFFWFQPAVSWKDLTHCWT